MATLCIETNNTKKGQSPTITGLWPSTIISKALELQINAVGTAGGSKYHGSIYTYGRTYQLDSTDWLSKYTNQPKPGDRGVYPGFTLGGPILVPHVNFNHDRDRKSTR